jgi:hypothetical protein
LFLLPFQLDPELALVNTLLYKKLKPLLSELFKGIILKYNLAMNLFLDRALISMDLLRMFLSFYKEELFRIEENIKKNYRKKKIIINYLNKIFFFFF